MDSRRCRQCALILCDMQGDLLQALTVETRQALLDAVRIAVDAAQRASWTIVWTGVRFPAGYVGVDPQHKLFGAFQKLNAKLGDTRVHWFLEGYDGSKIEPSLLPQDADSQLILWRQRHLPSNQLVEILREHNTIECFVVGLKAAYAVQATCQLLCDEAFQVSAVRECIEDDVSDRLKAVVNHILPIYANIISLPEMVEKAVGLDEYSCNNVIPDQATVRYCCDCGRGGHASLFVKHLLERPEWRVFPKQPWYNDFKTHFECPLGRQVLDFCDEPQFSRVSMYLKGREWLDEKEKLIGLAGNLMPETYLIHGKKWLGARPQECGSEDNDRGPWFVKEGDKNGGRAVQLCHSLAECLDLTNPHGGTYVVQPHIRSPMLMDDGRKCHIKFYSLLLCDRQGVWDLYTYKDAFLSVAPNVWSRDDISSETQITIKRSQRLQSGMSPEGWTTGAWPGVYNDCQAAVAQIVQKAIQEGKLLCREGKKQFEIFSADFMLDTIGRLWIIEFNFSPVLFDPICLEEQDLTTAGLKLYYKEYQVRGEEAVVNDRAMIHDALSMVFYDTLPTGTKWDGAGKFRQL